MHRNNEPELCPHCCQILQNDSTLYQRAWYEQTTFHLLVGALLSGIFILVFLSGPGGLIGNWLKQQGLLRREIGLLAALVFCVVTPLTAALLGRVFSTSSRSNLLYCSACGWRGKMGIRQKELTERSSNSVNATATPQLTDESPPPSSEVAEDPSGSTEPNPLVHEPYSPGWIEALRAYIRYQFGQGTPIDVILEQLCQQGVDREYAVKLIRTILEHDRVCRQEGGTINVGEGYSWNDGPVVHLSDATGQKRLRRLQRLQRERAAMKDGSEVETPNPDLDFGPGAPSAVANQPRLVYRFLWLLLAFAALVFGGLYLLLKL